MESFSSQHEHHHSYCHHPEPTLPAPGFPCTTNLEAAMAYQSCTSSFPPLVLQLQGSFHPSGAEASAAGGGDKTRMVSTERSSASSSSSLGSAQEMDGSGGKMSRNSKRSNAIADKSVKEKRARGHVDDVKAKEACGEPPLAGYIHVRAKRGQATNKHSIAERVRREKISEKMKMLESLVPGCDKVTGKALMLDEIICYVQSLQNQVEFLSMKLASLDPMMVDELFGLDFDMYPDVSQLLKMAETMPHELVQCMGQPTGTGAAEHTSPPDEAQGPIGFDQDGGSSHMMQELNSMNMCFHQ